MAAMVPLKAGLKLTAYTSICFVLYFLPRHFPTVEKLRRKPTRSNLASNLSPASTVDVTSSSVAPGKTTLLRQQFPKACWIDLLDYDQFLSLSQRPTRLRQILEAQTSKTVVIDEVQKIPPLMDEIHWLIENRTYQFILCGSSARKLRRRESGLLGGRAWRYELYPLNISSSRSAGHTGTTAK